MRSSVPSSRVFVVSFFLAAAASTGCGSSSGGSPMGGDGGSVSFTTDIYPIITTTCVPCHTAASGPSGGLDFSGSATAVYAKIVSQPPTTNASCTGLPSATMLIEPMSTANSLIYSKISTDTPVCGGRMPLGGALTPAQITLFATWINTDANL
jgi:hypothetical protein